MAFVPSIVGLTNGGITTHYNFSYDASLSAPAGPEPARTNAVIAECENDYNLISDWFGGGINVTGIPVQVTTQSGGASWSLSDRTITLKGSGNNPTILRYLIVSEVTEMFMREQNIGWFQGDEGSKGEGLSRFLSMQFLLSKNLGSMPPPGFAITTLWLNSSRQDFVNNNPDDIKPDAINGCTTLFLYYLHDQLRFTIYDIIAAGSSNLAGVYQKLTGQPDGWTPFINLVNSHYPLGFNYNPVGDNIFPVAELSAFFEPNIITCGYSEPAQIFINGPAMAEVNIQLTSNAPTLVSVLPTATIRVGSLSTSLAVSAASIPIPFPPKFSNVFASYAGKVLTISVQVVPPRVVSVTLSPDTVVCGDGSTGTVTLDRSSLLGPVVVDLICGDPGFASVPAQVTIPQDNLSATFAITTPNYEVPFQTAHPEIVATYSGSTVSARLAVESRVIVGILESLIISPSTVTGGNTSFGTVTLEKAVPMDTLVGLAAVEIGLGPLPLPSSNSSVASVPRSVKIHAGQTRATFTITTTKLPSGIARRRATIMAGAVVTKYAALTITS